MMCGIAGYHGFLGTPGERILRTMIDGLGHRGPDGRGMSVYGDVGLAAARLSLLDIQHGGQPMAIGDTAIVFNGEIYNHGDLRKELEQRGVVFSGRSDTEVLLRGFRQWGPSLFDRLEGMFAVAIRDGAVLHLARDAFGMKPMFYWISAHVQALAFSSEIKALLRCSNVPRRLDPTGLVEQLVFGHTLGRRTLLCDICQVAPGTHLAIERREERLVATTSRLLSPRAQPRPGRAEEAVDRLAEMLRESVTLRLHADHPVATYLSGGIDSTLVAALRPDRTGSRSFVVADGKHVADVTYARAAATALGLDHTEIMVSRTPPVSWVADAVLAMEGPFPPSLALVSAPRVRQAGKAAVCGEGADELFAGYPMHADPEPYLRRFEDRVLKLRGTALTEIALDTTTTRIATLRLRDPAAQFRAVYEFLLHEVLPNKHLAIWDRGAMASSLEIRMPYLDRGLRDFALSLPREWLLHRKELISAVARRVLPPAIAGEILARTKSAAPDALQATRHRLQSLTAAAMPRAWLRKHPLQCLSSSPHVLVMLDLFLLAFIVRDGCLPEAFAIETMYTQYERDFQMAHQAACEALFGTTGSAV